MWRFRRWRRGSVGAGLLLLAAATAPAAAHPTDPDPAPPGAASAAADERLVLAVTLDGVAQDEPVIVRRRGGALWMRAADLRALGVRQAVGDGDIALASIATLRVQVDDAAQVIALTTVGGDPQRLRVTRTIDNEDVPLARNGWGGVLNYDASAMHTPAAQTLASDFEAIVYTPHGFAFGGAIAAVSTEPRSRAFTRLDTGYTFADPHAVRRVTVGDYINAASSFSRPVRMAGVKVGTDFTLRPDLVTFPLPSLAGSAAVPSAVDLIVNGNRRALGDVRAGQFSVSDVPVQTGVNTITVAVKDALGRQTRQTVTTYASRALLRAGLAEYSLELGAVRTGYGSDADRYRKLAASGSLRHGLDDRTTAEAHFEATRSLATAGVGVSRSLGVLGLVDVNAGVSRSGMAAARRGTQIGAGYERVGRQVNVSARYTWSSHDWIDVAGGHGTITRQHAAVLNVGFDLGRLGTVGAGVIDLGRGWTTATTAGVAAPKGYADVRPTTLVNASYSARLTRRLNVVANVGSDVRQRGSTFASIGALMVFGPRTSSYVGATGRNGRVGANAEYVHTALEAGEWGYRASAATGAFDRISGGVEYLGLHGHADAQVERTNGAVAARLSARGSVVAAEGGVFAADTMTGSFAVIDTAGQPNVAIYRDNRRIGVSNHAGKLVVANLAAYQATKFAIDPTEIAETLTIAIAETRVRPRERVGVAVRFDLEPNRTARVRLVDGDGRPIAPGSRAAFGTFDLPVGMDGEVYLPRLGATNRIAVRLPGGRHCDATFAPPTAMTLATVIGPVRCVALEVAQRR